MFIVARMLLFKATHTVCIREVNVLEYFELPRINLTGTVDEKMIEDLDRQIKITPLEEGQKAVVTMTSGGGSVGYARAIYEELTLLQ